MATCTVPLSLRPFDAPWATPATPIAEVRARTNNNRFIWPPPWSERDGESELSEPIRAGSDGSRAEARWCKRINPGWVPVASGRAAHEAASHDTSDPADQCTAAAGRFRRTRRRSLPDHHLERPAHEGDGRKRARLPGVTRGRRVLRALPVRGESG